MNLYANIKDKHRKNMQRRETLKESSETKRKKLLDEASHVKSATEQLGTTGEVILTGKEMKEYLSTLDGNWSDLLLKIDNDDDYYRLYEGKLSDFPQSSFGGYHIEKIDDTGSQYRAKDESNPTKLEELISKVRGNAWSNDDSWNVSWFIQEWPESAEDGDVVTEEDINNMLDDSVEDIYLYNRHHPEDPQEIPTEEQLAHDKEVLKDFIGLTKEEIEKFSKDYFFADYFIKKRERLGESCSLKEEEIARDGAWLEPCYVPDKDVTVIFRHTIPKEDTIKEELVGYYYGKPEESATREMAKLNNNPLVIDMLKPEDIQEYIDIFNNDFLKESEKPLRETNYARYLGVKSSLLEKVNQANADINAKIREALRSKPAARKYEDEFKNAGITVDYSPREGVKLVGQNGRELTADRKNIYGPTKPGFRGTHDSGYYGSNVKGYKRDVQDYNERIAKNQAELDNPLDRDDIIRKYPNNTTEEALAKYERSRENIKNEIEYDKRWRKNAEEHIRDIHDKRQEEHNRELDNPQYSASDRAISNNAVALDKIDYKGYLDSKDNNENKDFNNSYFGRKRTKGQQTRDELTKLKRRVNDTVGSYTARNITNGLAVNDDYIKRRKQVLKDEYKKKAEELEQGLRRDKKVANDDFKHYNKNYDENVANLQKFRQENKLKARDTKDFTTYLNDKSSSY